MNEDWVGPMSPRLPRSQNFYRSQPTVEERLERAEKRIAAQQEEIVTMQAHMVSLSQMLTNAQRAICTLVDRVQELERDKVHVPAGIRNMGG